MPRVHCFEHCHIGVEPLLNSGPCLKDATIGTATILWRPFAQKIHGAVSR